MEKISKPRPKARNPIPPLPPDAPLLSIDDVALYLRTTRAAVRKMIEGRADYHDPIGERLRGWVVRLSPHRRYIRRGPFMAWLAGAGG